LTGDVRAGVDCVQDGPAERNKNGMRITKLLATRGVPVIGAPFASVGLRTNAAKRFKKSKRGVFRCLAILERE